MQIFPHKKSDREYVEMIRTLYNRTQQSKWLIILLAGISIGTLVLMATFAERLITQTYKIFQGTPIATFETGLGIGFIWGFILTLGVPSVVFLLASLFSDHRTYRLLLDYHDRLAQAGLLPGDASETMKSVEPASSRS